MSTSPLTTLMGYLRKASSGESRSDGQLMHSFVQQNDPTAFDVLLRRHASMVWGVCWRVLRNHSDSEDAFQATFLVFLKKSATLTNPNSVGNWLYGVAYHTALKAKSMKSRRNASKQNLEEIPTPEVTESLWQQLQPLLDSELSQLPEKYRSAIVLCDLECKTIKEVAKQLDCPQGTVASRLAKARKLLAERIARQGVTFSVSVFAFVLSQYAALAAPRSITENLSHYAREMISGESIAGSLSTTSTALAEGVLKSMFHSKMKLSLIIALVFGLGLLGIRPTHPLLIANEANTQEAKKEIPKERVTVKEVKKTAIAIAKELLKEAEEATTGIDDPQKKAWMLQWIGEILIQMKDKDAERVLELALVAGNDIPGDPKQHFFNDLTNVFAQGGYFKAAKELAEKIEQEDAKAYAFANISGAYANNGQIEEALKMLNEVQVVRHRATAQRNIAKAYAKSGKLKEALQIVEGTEQDVEKLFAMVAIVRSLPKDDENVKKLLESALTIGLSLPEEGDYRSVSYISLGSVHAERNDFEAAEKVIKLIKDDIWRDRGWREVVNSQAQRKDFKGALKTAENMMHEYPKGEALKDIVMAQLASGDIKSALKTFEGIQSVFYRVDTLCHIAKAQYQSGDKEAALKSFQRAIEEAGKEGFNIRDDEPGVGGLRNAGLSLIRHAQVYLGKETEAIEWAKGQTDSLLKVQGLARVAKAIAGIEEK